MTFAGIDVVLTKVWDDNNSIGGICPTTSGFTITNTYTPTPPEPGPNPAPEPDPTPAPSPEPDPDSNGKEVASILPKTADEGTLFAGAAGLAILSAVGGAIAVTARRREED